MLQSVNPATGETIQTYAQTSPEEAAGMIEATDKAFTAWRTLSFQRRGERMTAAA